MGFSLGICTNDVIGVFIARFCDIFQSHIIKHGELRSCAS